MLRKSKGVLVCPKCLKAYTPDKQTMNIFGVSAYGFKCKYCGYSGAGPIKLVKEKDD